MIWSLKRIVGFNFEKLHFCLNQATELHFRDFQYYGDSGNAWERFYDAYDRFSRTGEYDRDALRIFVDSPNDKHRGVGSI